MRMHWSMVGAAALVALAAATAAGPTLAEPGSRSVTVRYQCPGEEVKTFKYDATAGTQPALPQAQIEAQWYWERTRPDRGQGCKVLSAD